MLVIFAISLGLAFSLFLIVVCEVLIFLYARDNTKLFFFMWQLPFFIVLFLALLIEPNELFNYYKLPPLAQPMFLAGLVLVELITAALCFLGEKPIKAILFGSTTVMIAAVLLIIALIGSEGMMGLMENDPLEMLTSTKWSADFNPDLETHTHIPTVILPYDFGIRANNSVVHVQPDIVAVLSLTIMNKGALEDSYHINLVADPRVEHNLSQNTIVIGGNNISEIPFTLCSSTLGSYSVQVQVDSEHGEANQVLDIQFEVSNTGIELDREYERSVRSGAYVTLGNYPFTVTNTGTEGCNITFVVTSPSYFRPSISGTSSWVYSLSEGYSYLEAGETGKYVLLPRFVEPVEGVYDITIDVRVNGTDVHDTYNLVFDYKLARYAWSLYDWPMPLYPDTETEWKILVDGETNPYLYTMLTSIEDGYHATTILNGTEAPLMEEWNWMGLDKNRTGILTLIVTTSKGTIGETSELVMGFTSIGTIPAFGMAGFLTGTAVTVAFALLFAVPLALGSAIYLAEYAPSRVRRVVKPIMEILAGIPSVVYGLWGGLTLGPFLATTVYPFISSTLGTIIPFFEDTGTNMSRSIMTASLVLSIMIFPIIMALSYDAVTTVPSDLRGATLATGASKWQTIRRVVMVKAKSGILASVVLGMGRAIGETMAVLMIMGCTSRIPGNIFESVGTMTSAIASQFGQTFAYDASRHGLFAIAFVLFLIVLVLNLAVISITRERGGGRTNLLSRRLKALKRSVISRLDKGAKTTDIRSYFRPSVRSARSDSFAKWSMYACAATLMVVVAYIIGDVIIRGGSSFEFSFLFEVEEGTGAHGGGFLNAIIGSLALVAIAIGLSAPISVLAAIYVNEYADKSSFIVRMTTFATSTLAATPSIVYGAFGFMMFVLYLGFGFSLLAGGLTLALMAMPLIFVSAAEGLKAVPANFREASYALGVSKWATIKNVILPVSFSSISSGVIIAIGRTIGETAAIILTAGYASMVTRSLFMDTASLPNMIYKYFEYSFQVPNVGEKLYAASFVLIVIIIMLNLAARLIAARSQKKMGIEKRAV